MNTLEEKRRLCRVSGVTVFVAGLLAAAANLLMLTFFYDNDLRLFERGLPLKLFFALLLLGCLLAVCFPLLFRKAEAPEWLPAPGTVGTLLSALCGFFLLATVGMQVVYLVCKLDPGNYSVEYSRLMQLVTGGKQFVLADGLQMLSLILALPASLYFLFPAFSDKPETAPRVIFGTCFVLWALAQTMVANFRVETIPMNSPLRLEPMLAGVGAALWLLSEMRFLVGKGKLGLLFAGATVGAIFAGGYGLTVVALTAMGKISAGLQTVYGAVYLLLGCCIAARMLCAARLVDGAPETEPAPVQEALPEKEASVAAEPAPTEKAADAAPAEDAADASAPEKDAFLEQLLGAFGEEEPAANDAPLAFPDEKE